MLLDYGGDDDDGVALLLTGCTIEVSHHVIALVLWCRYWGDKVNLLESILQTVAFQPANRDLPDLGLGSFEKSANFSKLQWGCCWKRLWGKMSSEKMGGNVLHQQKETTLCEL